MDWSLACPDWRERLREGRSLVPSLPLFRGKADQAVAVFNRLRLADVPGTPTLETAAGEWFRDIVRALHGSLDPATRTRIVREVFLLVPKKNSKTTNAALLMLASLLVNERPNAEFLLIAPTQKVSELAFDQITGAIALDPFLLDLLHVQTHLKRITHQRTGAQLEIKSFDPKVVTGSKASGVLIDEIHVVAGTAEADRVIRQLRGGLISQPEGFMVMITTQSERPPAGVFKAELERARAVRDGLRDDAVLPVLYEFPDELAVCKAGPDGLFPWEDPAVWHMVTPNNGRSITVDRLIPDYRSAKQNGLEELRGWASQHLNIEIGLGLRADRWPGADFWEGQAERDLSLEELLDRSEVLTIGIDGGGLDDLLSMAVCGRDRIDPKRWRVWTHSWAHPSVLERRKAESGRLRDFEADGDLTIVERMGEDLAELVTFADQVNATGKLAMVGLDPAGVGAVVDALAEVGIGGEEDTGGSDRVVGVSQGWQLQGAVKTTERKLADGSLTHCGQPIMAWAVGNAKTEQRGNAIVVTKQAAGSAKIDPLMATFDAVALMTKNPAAPRPSVYEARGILLV